MDMKKKFIKQEGGSEIWKNAKCVFTCWYFVSDERTTGYLDEEIGFYVFDDGHIAIRDKNETVYLSPEHIEVLEEFLAKIKEEK